MISGLTELRRAACPVGAQRHERGAHCMPPAQEEIHIQYVKYGFWWIRIAFCTVVRVEKSHAQPLEVPAAHPCYPTAVAPNPQVDFSFQSPPPGGGGAA